MPEGGARTRMEPPSGHSGRGRREPTIAGQALRLRDGMRRLGPAFGGYRTIDGFEQGAGRFAVRFSDPEAPQFAADGFDDAFRDLGGTRVHVIE
jgi:hypothetical protein